ncbi:uncharacterized protein LOC107616039 [Arachis ipaensis]|uniref:uncharacterized protein LOC107616039 n=1 Tax=Arachis ipaensis TaxID=130454 RepID=UPI0007AF8E57|nr:uncharacterized protein LOC107616039 [Arachis ipaensis]
MQPPPGLPISSPDPVCKLNKSLYGLKQARRQWNLKLCSVLLTHGYKQSKNDYSLFTKSAANSSFTVILAYINDLVLIKDLGNLKYFLGFEVARTKAGISLYQRKYALDLLEECGLLGAKPASTPIEYTLKLSKEFGSPLTDVKQYRRLIGHLVYLTNTRPGISFAVGKLSESLDKPTDSHLQAAIRILKYIKSAPASGLFFAAFSELRLSGFADSDWAQCPDTPRFVTANINS